MSKRILAGRPSILPVAILAVALAGASVASAEARFPGRRVAFGDLDLTSDAGAKQLLRRITIAANGICHAEDFGQYGFEPRERYAVCVQRTVDQAVKDVGVERVTYLHHNRRAAVVRTASQSR